MTFEELKNRMISLQQYAAGLGWTPVRYMELIQVDGAGEEKLGIWLHDKDSEMKSMQVYSVGDIVELEEWVWQLPTMTEHMKGKFRQKLANLTAEAEDLEIGLEYVAMLRATAKKLAENALPAPRPSAEQPDDPIYSVEGVLGDEIPF
jgi:hypothetical protein